MEGGRRRGRQRMRWQDGITDSIESEWTPGVGNGQGGLACCDSWGRKELDMIEWLNWTELNWSLNLESGLLIPQAGNHPWNIHVASLFPPLKFLPKMPSFIWYLQLYTLPWAIFILLKYNFAGKSISGWHFLSFSILRMSFCSCLACRVSAEKSDSLLRVPL